MKEITWLIGNGLFHVIGYNGRLGNQLVAQPKTRLPVPFATARRIFDQLEQAKLCHRKTPYKFSERENFTADSNNANVNNTANTKIVREEKEQTQEQETEAYQADHLDALEL